MAGEKSNDIEYENRVFTVKNLLCRFMTRREILQYIAKKTDWKVKERMVDNYIAEAKEELKKEVDKPVLKGVIQTELGNLYKKNMAVEDFKECRGVLESYAKLFGVAEAEKIDHSIVISFED